MISRLAPMAKVIFRNSPQIKTSLLSKQTNSINININNNHIIINAFSNNFKNDKFKIQNLQNIKKVNLNLNLIYINLSEYFIFFMIRIIQLIPLSYCNFIFLVIRVNRWLLSHHLIISLILYSFIYYLTFVPKSSRFLLFIIHYYLIN